MNRIMFAMAAVAAGVAIEAGAIESSNVVGYEGLTAVQGFNMLIPTFQDVSGGEYSIQDIKPSGDGLGGWGDVNIQMLDTEGNWSAQYDYWTAAMGAPGGVDGWYDSESQLANVTLKAGQGVVIYADTGAITVTVSGQVKFSADTVDKYAGFNGAGNTKPVGVALQSIVPNDVGGWGDANVQFIDAAGNWSAQYDYWTAAMGAPGGVDGWYDSDSQLADVTLDPGAGFVFYVDGINCTLTIPEIGK